MKEELWDEGEGIPIWKSPTEARENPLSEVSSVSEILTFLALVIPKVMVPNLGKIIKLIVPTVAKFGAVRVCKPVKFNNSNVPEMFFSPEALKDVREEIWPTRISPLTYCTESGIVTVSIATDWMRMLPVMIEQNPRALRSSCELISNPLVFVQVEFPWARGKYWLILSCEEGLGKKGSDKSQLT